MTNTTRTELQTEAFNAGVNAYARGAKSTPCLDRECLQIISQNPGSALVVLTAWVSGWDTANAKAAA